MNHKITNGKLLIFEEDKFNIKEADLYIKDGCIASVGNAPAGDDAFTEVNASGKLVMPGLINMHTHAYMTVLRNYADDVGFAEWLFERIMPVEDSLSPEDAYTANLLAFAEMFTTGTTSFVDMHMFKGMSCRAATEAGIRGFIGRGLVGEDLYKDGKSRFDEAMSEMEEYGGSSLLNFIISPHAIYSASPLLYSQAAREADRLGLRVQTHLSESRTEVSDCLKKYGKTPVALLKETGFLDGGAILAHCVHLQDDDMDIIKQTGSFVVTNPASNAKLGNGFAPVNEMLKKEIPLCLGTDGTSSNNSLNMFREIGLLSLIHKGLAEDPTVLCASEVLKAVTVNAAKALGMEGKLGIIKESAKADLIFLDLNAPSMYPNNNIISSLCYSASGSEVTDVMVDGSFVMREHRLLTIDMEKIYRDSESWKRFR